MNQSRSFDHQHKARMERRDSRGQSEEQQRQARRVAAREAAQFNEALEVEEDYSLGYVSSMPPNKMPSARRHLSDDDPDFDDEEMQTPTKLKPRPSQSKAPVRVRVGLGAPRPRGVDQQDSMQPSAATTPRNALSSPANADTNVVAVSNNHEEPAVEASAAPRIQMCVRPVLQIAIPISCTNFVRNAASFITIYFIGNFLKREEFAGVGAGLTFANLTALSIGIGLSCALDTFCSQEYGRNPQSKKLGIFLQRGCLAVMLLYLPVSLFYFYSEAFLRLFMSERLAGLAAYWLKLSIPITVPQLLTTCVSKFAQAQCEPKVPMYAATSGLITLPPALYLCRDMGIEGVAMALAINRWLTFLTVVTFVARTEKLRNNFGKFSGEAFYIDELIKYFKVGLPSMMAFAADFWAFEAMTVIAAHLGELEVGAWVVLMNIYSLFFGPSVGVSAASCVKIGNALGAGDGNLARNMMKATLVVATGLAAIESMLILFFGKWLYELLTVDAEIIKKGSSIMPVAFITFFIDVFFYVCQGIFRGCKKQGMSAIIVCASMWGVGVPLALYLTTVQQMSVMGLLLGLTGGVATATPIFLYIMNEKIDWVHYANMASKGKRQAAPQQQPPQASQQNDEPASPSDVGSPTDQKKLLR